MKIKLPEPDYKVMFSGEWRNLYYEESLKQAVRDVLEEAARDFLVNIVFDGDLLDKINEALAETEQKPVAWLVGAKQWVYFDKKRAEDEAKFSGELVQPLYSSPQAREAQASTGALENIASYLGIGGFNGATVDQLEARIRSEFDRIKPCEWQELREYEVSDLGIFPKDYKAISAALRAKNEVKP